MAGEIPSTAARALVAIGAAVVALGLAAYLPWLVLQGGHPWTAAFLAATAALLALFLAAIAAVPEATQRVLARFTRIRLADRGHLGATILLCGALYFVFGQLLAGGVYAIEDAALHGVDNSAQTLDARGLAQSIVLSLAILTLPVILYVSFVGGSGPGGALRELGFIPEGAGRQVASGILVAMGFLAALVALSAILLQFHVAVPQNQRALDIAKSLTWLGAIGIAAGAALGEEVFFRGFLLPRVGLIAQAILFALLHLSYVNVLEIVVTLSLALALGLMRRRTGSIWGPIAAHFAFDFLQLLVGIYAPDAP